MNEGKVYDRKPNFKIRGRNVSTTENFNKRNFKFNFFNFKFQRKSAADFLAWWEQYLKILNLLVFVTSYRPYTYYRRDPTVPIL